MLKRFILSAVCAACVAAPSYADTIRTVINGRTVLLQQAPVVRSGVVYVPLQDLIENSGGRVVYDPGSRSLVAYRGSRIVRLDLGSNVALIDGVNIPLDSAPVDMHGHVMVPLAFAERALGADLVYSPSLSTVTMVSEPSAVVYQAPVTESYYSHYTTAEPLVRPLALPATTSVDAITMNVANGQIVPEVFTLQGRTAPNATVRVTTIKDGVAIRSALSDAYTLENRARDYMTTADSLGFFEVQVDTSAVTPGSDVLMKVQASDPVGNKGSMHRLTLHRR